MRKLIFILFMLAGAIASGQNKSNFDKIFFLNGDTLNVKIQKITDKEVDYLLPSTTFMNTVNKKRLNKIIFRDGQVQHFTAFTSPKKLIKREIEKNKIAILPIPFMWGEDGSLDTDEKAYFAQSRVYRYLQGKTKNISPLKLQTPRETNTLLKASGIEITKLNQIPIADLQNCLGVDYIIFSNIEYTFRKYLSSESEIKGKIDGDDIKGTSEGVTTEQTLFFYTVFIDVFHNEQNIYSRTRKPLLKHRNSWLLSVEYLLKRMPIYH